MKNLLLLFIILIAVNHLVSAQQASLSNAAPQAPGYSGELPVARYLGIFFMDMNNQFSSDWCKGDIILTNGNIIRQQLIRYNNFQDELIWMRNADYKAGILLKEAIQEFIIYPKNGGPKQVFKKVYTEKLLSNNDKYMFYQALASGECSFISLRKFEIDNSPKKYYPSYQYYMQRNGNLTRFKMNRLALFNLFENEEKSKIKSIVRSNHLHVAKERDMIRAFELFNE